MASAKPVIAQTASLLYAFPVLQFTFMELFIILQILFVKNSSQESSPPQSCVVALAGKISYWAKMAHILNNCLKTIYVVKVIGKKAEWADEGYPPNEGDRVQMKRSLHLQALGIAWIIIPRFKR